MIPRHTAPGTRVVIINNIPAGGNRRAVHRLKVGSVHQVLWIEDAERFKVGFAAQLSGFHIDEYSAVRADWLALAVDIPAAVKVLETA